MDEVKDWLMELSLGDELPARNYDCKEMARLAKKCLALIHENDTFTTMPVANQHNLYVSPLYYSCKECFADLHKPMRYCWYCGRRILWNDEKNEIKTSNDHF